MATPKINENCHYMQMDPHKCKIKLEKFHFDTLCCFGVIKESPGEMGLMSFLSIWNQVLLSLTVRALWQ